MNSATWLLRLRGVQLSVLLALVQARYDVFTAVEIAEVVGYSRQRVAWALGVLEREDWVYRVHRTGWRCSVTAVEFVYKSLLSVDTLHQGTKMLHSTSQNVTLSENGRDPEDAQRHIMLHSTSHNVTLGFHDHDHDDDEGDNSIDFRILRLEEIGFQDARRWLSSVDGRLVDDWLKWEAGLDSDGRSRFRSVGGFIRKQVAAGERPSLRSANQTPASMVGMVKR
jgi:hypothetical protein